MTEHRAYSCEFICIECNRHCCINCDGFTDEDGRIYALDKVEYPLNCPCKNLSRRMEGLHKV